MEFLLRVLIGTHAGAEVPLKEEDILRVGRGAAVNFSIPDDHKLSSAHFELRTSKQSCEIRDLQSTNGTFVNGQRIAAASLTVGDRIRAGGSEFLFAAAPAMEQKVPGSGYRFGDWILAQVPADWELVEGIGIKTLGPGGFYTNLAFTAEMLQPGQSLVEYIQIQIAHLQRLMPTAKTEPAEPDFFDDVDEARGLLIHLPTQEGNVVCQKQTYVQSGARVGILTLTTFEGSLTDAQKRLSSGLRDIRFRPKEPKR